MKNTKFIKNNRTIVFFTILVGLFFSVSHIINIYNHSYELYNPTPFLNGLIGQIDEVYVGPGFRDVIDGHYIVKNPQLKEYKNDINHIDIIPYFLLGYSAKAFGFGVKEIFIFTDFIFPALGFFLLYVLMTKVFCVDKYLSILVALLITIFQSFTVFILGIFNLNSFNFFAASDPLGQSKLYAPEFVFIPFLVAIIFLYYSFKKNNYLYPLLTIVFGTSLVYSYIYYSTFYWMAFVLFSLSTLFIYKINIRQQIKKILFILIPSAILSIPYFLQFIEFSKLQNFPEILIRAGLERGRFIHIPLIFAFISGIFLIILYFVIYKKNKINFYFLASMVVSGTLWTNMQVFTGQNIQPFHWTYRILEVLYFICFAYIIQELYKIIKNRKTNGFIYYFDKIIGSILGFLLDRRLLVVLVIFFIVYGFGYSIAATLKTGDIYKFGNSEIQLYNWLNKNTPLDSTVITLSLDQNIKISTQTHNNIYIPSLVENRPTEEIFDRVLFSYDLYNVSDDELYIKLNQSDTLRTEYINELYKGKKFSLYDFEKYIFIHYLFHLQFFYGKWSYQQQNPDDPNKIGYYFPLKVREYVISRRHNKSYKVYSYDYVLVGPYEKQIMNINKVEMKFIKEYSNEDFILFKKVGS